MSVTSIFNRVLGEHEKSQAAEALALRERAEAVASSRSAFLVAFREDAANVVRPILAEFVADAVARGFTARIDESLDDPARPAIALFVNPRQGRMGEQAASEYCSFELAALVETSEVQHISHFDLRANDRGHRINPDGTKKGAFGLASMQREGVEREVEEFWRLSLRSRKPE